MSNCICECLHEEYSHHISKKGDTYCEVSMCPCLRFKAFVKSTDQEKTTIPITEHEGRKYLKKIWPAAKMVGDGTVPDDPILVDVYCVIEAFKVTCPGRQQALKKLLMAGDRGKGDAVADLIGAQAAINRAIELARQREREATGD